MPRIALGIEYDGTDFAGWQRQREQRSVQECLERALSAVADHPVEVVAAGRTDAGVHAAGQVVHCDVAVDRGERAWVFGANSQLPPDISVHWARVVPDGFHARYSALARSYRYSLWCAPTRSALLRRRAWWVRRRPHPGRMLAAAVMLLGEHDFSSYRAAECQAKRPWRKLTRVAVRRDEGCVHVEFTANAFLHHMVRNLVGTLYRIGVEEADVFWAREVLDLRDRRTAGVTAPAAGLTLLEVDYPESFGLPGPGACGRVGPALS